MGDDRSRPPQVSPKQPLPSLAQWAPSLAGTLVKPLQKMGGQVADALGTMASAASAPPPTPLSALGSLATPSAAPRSIAIDLALHQQFQSLMADHVKEGKNERGGTLVALQASAAALTMIHAGASSKGDVFHPDLSVGNEQKVAGSFHTHYDTNVGDIDKDNPTGAIATSLGGGDIEYSIDNQLTINVVYTGGDKDFVLVRTDATPPSIDTDLKAEYQAKQDALEGGAHRRSAAEATQQLAKEYAAKYGFALYEGKNGNLTRVEPP